MSLNFLALSPFKFQEAIMKEEEVVEEIEAKLPLGMHELGTWKF